MVEAIVIAAVLAFLLGMAVGIAGYFFCTILRYEKEIEGIFDSMCQKYDRKLKRKEEENRRLSDKGEEIMIEHGKDIKTAF